MHTTNALLLVAGHCPSIAADAMLMTTLLTDMPSGLGSLPASVLAAAFEAMAFGAGPYHRRAAYLEAALFLASERQQPQDIGLAVGLWGAMIGRATQLYRGRAATPPPPAGTPDPAGPLAALITAMGADLAALVEAAAAMRVREAADEQERKARAAARPRRPSTSRAAGATEEAQAHG